MGSRGGGYSGGPGVQKALRDELMKVTTLNDVYDLKIIDSLFTNSNLHKGTNVGSGSASSNKSLVKKISNSKSWKHDAPKAAQEAVEQFLKKEGELHAPYPRRVTHSVPDGPNSDRYIRVTDKVVDRKLKKFGTVYDPKTGTWVPEPAANATHLGKLIREYPAKTEKVKTYIPTKYTKVGTKSKFTPKPKSELPKGGKLKPETKSLEEKAKEAKARGQKSFTYNGYKVTITERGTIEFPNMGNFGLSTTPKGSKVYKSDYTKAREKRAAQKAEADKIKTPHRGYSDKNMENAKERIRQAKSKINHNVMQDSSEKFVIGYEKKQQFKVTHVGNALETRSQNNATLANLQDKLNKVAKDKRASVKKQLETTRKQFEKFNNQEVKLSRELTKAKRSGTKKDVESVMKKIKKFRKDIRGTGFITFL